MSKRPNGEARGGSIPAVVCDRRATKPVGLLLINPEEPRWIKTVHGTGYKLEIGERLDQNKLKEDAPRGAKG